MWYVKKTEGPRVQVEQNKMVKKISVPKFHDSFGKSSIAHYSRFHLAVVIEMRAISDKAMARILEFQTVCAHYNI